MSARPARRALHQSWLRPVWDELGGAQRRVLLRLAENTGERGHGHATVADLASYGDLAPLAGRAITGALRALSNRNLATVDERGAWAATGHGTDTARCALEHDWPLLD